MRASPLMLSQHVLQFGNLLFLVLCQPLFMVVVLGVIEFLTEIADSCRIQDRFWSFGRKHTLMTAWCD
jgi:hypothetical protein